MSIGDKNLTQRNIDRVFSSNRYVLVQVTSSIDCNICCEYEDTVKSFYDKALKSPDSPLYEHNIILARFDMVNADWFRDRFNVHKLPDWFFINNGKLTNFINSADLTRNIEVMRRSIHPIEELHSMRMIREFLDGTKVDISNRKLIRAKALALLSEPEEFEELILQFKEGASTMSWREDVVFGICTNPKIIREAYKEYGRRIFPDEFDLNTFVLHHIKNRFDDHNSTDILDISKIGSQGVGMWMAQKSIQLVDEMNSLNQYAFSDRIPLLIAFLNPNHEKESQEFIWGYKKLAERHRGQIGFAWVDYADNLKMMKRLGVYNCKYIYSIIF